VATFMATGELDTSRCRVTLRTCHHLAYLPSRSVAAIRVHSFSPWALQGADQTGGTVQDVMRAADSPADGTAPGPWSLVPGPCVVQGGLTALV
jgi:hypothetical protein